MNRAKRMIKARGSETENIFIQFCSISTTLNLIQCSKKYFPMNPMEPIKPTDMYVKPTKRYPQNTSLSLFFYTALLRTIGKETVWRKYPMPSAPAKGLKSALNNLIQPCCEESVCVMQGTYSLVGRNSQVVLPIPQKPKPIINRTSAIINAEP